MEIVKTISKKENSLFKRTEIKLIVKDSKNPSFSEAEILIAKELSSSPDKVKIKEIQGKFGRDTFLISANVYNSSEDKDSIEPKIKPKKGAK